MKKRRTLRQRIKEKIWNRGYGVCHPWLGHIDIHGYAKIWYNGTATTAHQIVWILTYGKIPQGRMILTCPLLKDCCNPEHLWAGDTTDLGDRMLYKTKRKRHVKRLYKGKLTPDQVVEIYLSKESGPELAKRFGYSRQMIWKIRKGLRYPQFTNALKERSDEDANRESDN